MSLTSFDSLVAAATDPAPSPLVASENSGVSASPKSKRKGLRGKFKSFQTEFSTLSENYKALRTEFNSIKAKCEDLSAKFDSVNANYNDLGVKYESLLVAANALNDIAFRSLQTPQALPLPPAPSQFILMRHPPLPPGWGEVQARPVQTIPLISVQSTPPTVAKDLPPPPAAAAQPKLAKRNAPAEAPDSATPVKRHAGIAGSKDESGRTWHHNTATDLAARFNKDDGSSNKG